jgi:GDP-L-fucose synthase
MTAALPPLSARYGGRRVLVTGASGFLGAAVVQRLRAEGAEVWAPRRSALDLLDRRATVAALAGWRPAIVVHCAVDGGGLGWMAAHPVESGLHNVLMNAHIIEAAANCGAERFLGAGSACAYPRLCPVPFVEDSLWDGYPEPTNGPYAQSKRTLIDLCAAYWSQHRFFAVTPLLANLYGPGDHLEPGRSHVVAALLQRVVALSPDAPLVVWGSGRPTREFLFIDDAAEGLLRCADLEQPTVINIGTGVEHSIAELAAAVCTAAGHSGGLQFDSSQPDGQPRKCLSAERAAALLGWRAQTSLADGLARTVAWYRAARSA